MRAGLEHDARKKNDGARVRYGSGAKRVQAFQRNARKPASFRGKHVQSLRSGARI